MVRRKTSDVSGLRHAPSGMAAIGPEMALAALEMFLAGNMHPPKENALAAIVARQGVIPNVM